MAGKSGCHKGNYPDVIRVMREYHVLIKENTRCEGYNNNVTKGNIRILLMEYQNVMKGNMRLS